MLLHCDQMKAEIKRRLRYHAAEFGVTLDLMADDVEMTTEMDGERLHLCVKFKDGPSWRIPFEAKAEDALRQMSSRG